MASSSSNSVMFHAVDQMDEDFFDKLVDDDDFGIGGTETGGVARVLSDGSLGVSEDGAVESSRVEAEIAGEDVGSAAVGSKPFAFEKVVPVDDRPVEVVALELGSTGLTVEKSAEETGIKEVQWSAFASVGEQHDLGGFGSYSDFFLKDDSGGFPEKVTTNQDSSCGVEESAASDLSTCFGNLEQQGGQVWDKVNEQATRSSLSQQQDGQASLDANDLQYWESLYPGWKYDYNTGQWYQVGSYDTNSNAQVDGYGGVVVAEAESSQVNTQLAVGRAQIDSYGSNLSTQLDGFGGSHSNTQLTNANVQPVAGQEIGSDQSFNVSYLQQTVQSVVQSVAEGTTATVSDWNYASQETSEYPANMIFDPQYPGWYYDTYTQQWQTLESYTQSVQMTTINQDTSVDSGTSGGYSLEQKLTSYDNGVSQIDDQMFPGQTNHVGGDWGRSLSNYPQQNLWQPQPQDSQASFSDFSGNQQKLNFYNPTSFAGNCKEKEASFKLTGAISNQGYGNGNGTSKSQGFIPAKSIYQYNQRNVEQCQQTSTPHGYSGNQTIMSYSQQSFQSERLTPSQFSYNAMEGRSSARRPAHALVTFGFGGKLVVMKNTSTGTNSAYGSQDAAGGTISILNLADAIMEKSESSGFGLYNLDYFYSLCKQSFPGPLVGGNATSKDLNKWIDERIASCETASMDFKKGEHLRLLLSLLKISHQYYGKLRSPFGTDSSFSENDGPESAMTKLFASSRKNGTHLTDYGAFTHCMYNLPTEGQSQATAAEIQTLLVSGKRKEALQCAQDGMLWGPALVLGAQLGEKFYIDTVKQMANSQFVCGSPLRTLCLLIAGQPADVFSDGALNNSFSSEVIVPQRSGQGLANGMLDDWEKNLAIISANRTKDDELVIVHLGDCLWKERGKITAAHTCYLIAEANFESYSESARLCLIGADHWNSPRTYTSPEAIQRTEFYEYSKVLGNPQFQLLPFQPYKLIYAYMLAEVGKVSDSLRYCQAILKLLKNAGHSPEVEMWKTTASSLEDRLRMHQQGGYGTNLAPAKLVGKLFTTIDKSIHRMIGAPPPLLPPTPENRVQGNEYDSLSVPQKVAGSQSTKAMTSLMPSASVEAISEWTGDGRRNMHNRSVSEPDFGRSPKQEQANTSCDASSSDVKSKTSNLGGSSRFGLFGSGLLQKTMGWVSRSHSDRQAKLGETNKFYYDEKLKRWVEEGAEPPPQEAAPPPPPTMSSFQNGVSDYNINSALKSQNSLANRETEAIPPTAMQHSSGIPPMPPSQNQFSARGRMGVRSRYVDTFNKGGGAVASSFQPPSSQPVKPMSGAKFFVPAPISDTDGAATESNQESSGNEDASSMVPAVDSSFSSLSSPPLSYSMHRFSSMDNITPLRNKNAGMGMQNGDASLTTPSRAASWSGSFSGQLNPKVHGSNTSEDELGSPPYVVPNGPRNQTRGSPQFNGGSLGDDLHEVEL